jgi:hypothetical protein
MSPLNVDARRIGGLVGDPGLHFCLGNRLNSASPSGFVACGNIAMRQNVDPPGIA